jgi:hypothetical protein
MLTGWFSVKVPLFLLNPLMFWQKKFFVTVVIIVNELADGRHINSKKSISKTQYILKIFRFATRIGQQHPVPDKGVTRFVFGRSKLPQIKEYH